VKGTISLNIEIYSLRISIELPYNVRSFCSNCNEDTKENQITASRSSGIVVVLNLGVEFNTTTIVGIFPTHHISQIIPELNDKIVILKDEDPHY